MSDFFRGELTGVLDEVDDGMGSAAGYERAIDRGKSARLAAAAAGRAQGAVCGYMPEEAL
ncbi:MAG: hypothetical protein ACJ76X_12545 [Solirubrobacteraceae bacterium]